MAADMRVPGHIMPLGRTRNRRVSPAKVYPNICVDKVRWNFFYIVWLSAFLFYFLPGLLFPALSFFNVITWFAPDNVIVANLFGVVSGLGLFPVTFDWAQVAYIGSPLLTPFWAAMNVVGGLVVVMWVIAPIAYYNNWLYSSYMPPGRT